MRSSAIALATTLAACSSPPGVIDPPPPDGPSGGEDAGSIDAALLPPPRGFQIVTPSVSIDPGAEVTFCYYFRTPNTTEMSIKRWTSHMMPGSHHMIVFLTPTKLREPGTMSTEQCGFSSGGSGPVWTYSAHTPDAQAVLPADDGQGKPVGQPVKAGQYGFIQVHYLNSTDRAIQPRVELNAEAYDEGVQVTPAGPFVTYNDQINIPPGTPTNPSRSMVTGTCDFTNFARTSPLNFFGVSTHTHKQGSHTLVTDGAQTVFDGTSWENPGIRAWNTAPFFTFTTNKLTYLCEYVNPNNRTIRSGTSVANDEVCMAVGYYFPAVGGIGHLCWDSAMVY